MLSNHFTRKEFECPCGCGKDTVDAELIAVLEDLRQKLGTRPIRINSGYRCDNYNARIGGSSKSMHCQGKAADIAVPGIRPDVVADCLEDTYPDKYGIGRYAGWVHVDVRGKKARWRV